MFRISAANLSLAAALLGASFSGAVAGTVSGRVVNTHGDPIPGVKITAEHTVFRSYLPAVTDANGHYAINLETPPGAWELSAELRREYNGNVYMIHLHPDIDEAVGNEGGTRDFTWKIVGQDANGDELGGWVYIHPDEMMAKDIEITFTPDGPLMDGSTGKPMTVIFTKPLIKTIPLGRYVLKARYLPTGQPLMIHPSKEDSASLNPTVMFPVDVYTKRPAELDLDISKPK